MAKITAHVLPARGCSREDVAGAVARCQHPRAVYTLTTHPAGAGVLVVLTVPHGVSPAELVDMAARIESLTDPTVAGVDAVRVAHQRRLW